MANHYLPAAGAYAARAADKGKAGAGIVEWQAKLANGWGRLSFGPLKVETNGNGHRYEVPVYPGEMDASAFRIELFADGQNGEAPSRIPMNRGDRRQDGGFLYSASIDGGRNPGDFTPRAIPDHDGASVPLEVDQILWQK